MSTANQKSNDTPIPAKHVATVASAHSVSEAALTEALEQLYGTLFEGADAIHQYYESADHHTSFVVTDGIAEVIFIPDEMRDQLQTDFDDELRAAVKSVHAEFA
jgi:hypothetical protein